MVNLSDDILRSFTSSLKEKKADADVTMFGEVVRLDSSQYAAVKLDGSNAETLARIATVCDIHDRVTVLIKDHKAIITGNLDSPASASSESAYIRVNPDGSISIGTVDEEGHPNGFYVKATGTNYQIINPTNNHVIVDVTSDGIDITGSGTINGNSFDYEAGNNIVFTTDEDTGKVSISATISSVLDVIYPVGAIYMSVNSTNPATIFGGTWEQIQNKFLLAAGSSYAAGSTGGEATHTLTINEMPSHTHKSGSNNMQYAYGGNPTIDGPASGSGYATPLTDINTGSAGNGQAHNNMPPYLAVYVWKRTA